MADIELVIKIPKELYESYKGIPPMLGDAGMDMIAQSIANGVPLPAGHGKIIDVNNLMEEMKATRTYDIPFALERVKPIIEADKGVLDQINEKQDSLRATCKAWDEAISRDGYVD